MAISPALFSSESVEHYTPPDLVSKLAAIYTSKCCFTLDPCAPNRQIAKAEKFFTPSDDGLKQSWAGEEVFLNPPYGRGVINKWVEKAYREAKDNGALVVALLPARTDTAWWQDFIEPGRLNGSVKVHFLRGRVRFGNPEDPYGKKTKGAPFPSAVVVWGLVNTTRDN